MPIKKEFIFALLTHEAAARNLEGVARMGYEDVEIVEKDGWHELWGRKLDRMEQEIRKNARR